MSWSITKFSKHFLKVSPSLSHIRANFSTDLSLLAKNAFELFDVSLTFKIDEKHLKTQYHSLQQSYHVDHVNSIHNQSLKAQEDISAFINLSYVTLKYPLLRLEYILKNYGKNHQPPEVSFIPMLFLLQQIEWRTDLQDSSKSVEEKKKIYIEIMQQIDEVFEKCAQILDKPWENAEWSTLWNYYYQLKFFYQCKEEAEQILS